MSHIAPPTVSPASREATGLCDAVSARDLFAARASMGLVVALCRSDNAFECDYDNAFAFEDEAIFWCLRPTFNVVYDRTGQIIDLYETALFRGADLAVLREALTAVRRDIQGQPEQWEVHVGTQPRPTFKELYRTVTRTKVLDLIDRCRDLIDMAEGEGVGISFTGD